MTTASWGRSSSAPRVIEPKRSIPVLVTNTPASGRLGAQAGSRARGSGPTLSRMRKWTQPQERKKARTGGDEGEAWVELEEELKGRKVKLPYRRASSLALEWLRELKRATDELSVAWGRDGGDKCHTVKRHQPDWCFASLHDSNREDSFIFLKETTGIITHCTMVWFFGLSVWRAGLQRHVLCARKVSFFQHRLLKCIINGLEVLRQDVTCVWPMSSSYWTAGDPGSVIINTRSNFFTLWDALPTTCRNTLQIYKEHPTWIKGL